MELDDRSIQAVWEHGRVVPGHDDSLWRKDECGAWIQRELYNHQHAEFGWTICSTQGNDNGLDHLRPLHVQNEYDPAARVPHCRVSEDRTALAPTAVVDNPRNKTI